MSGASFDNELRVIGFFCKKLIVQTVTSGDHLEETAPAPSDANASKVADRTLLSVAKSCNVTHFSQNFVLICAATSIIRDWRLRLSPIIFKTLCLARTSSTRTSEIGIISTTSDTGQTVLHSHTKSLNITVHNSRHFPPKTFFQSIMAQFSDLPQELRDIIWEMALRARRPGAHFFTVYQYSMGASIIDPSCRIQLLTEDEKIWYQSSGLAAPCRGPDGSFSWTEGNPSTYMEDAALWTTSPLALQRDTKEPQSFMIHPKTDLIIIQASPYTSLSWDRDSRKALSPSFVDDLREIFLMYTRFICSLQSWLLHYPRNIAIELDSKWRKHPQPFVERCQVVLKMTRVETVWFIDYSLKRDTHRLKSEKGGGLRKNRAVFYAMDRRFIEIQPCDSEWTVWDREANKSIPRTAIDFVSELDGQHGVFIPILKVLGCEPL
ncbi:hypothetical protein N8I77_004871 [Diaporthe amygdali]|uniref:Uncharacterized protein n=1 Tax=Phomopsis amygdali TaxID=1214568 RepID=A0AAD9SM87_PHOAM|nr:hypothetical protein N8I77_004871 [Diaporthe amygdali]